MAWYNVNYQYKKSIVIDHTKVITADQSNFPVRVSMTDADLKVAGSGGKVQNSSGFDIIFVDSTETTKLDHEIEKYVSSTGEVEMHIRVPSASHTVDTTIYMYFDNSSISTSQENKTGVWDSSFRGVYHLKEATGSNAVDSTSNGYTATPIASPTQGAAQIDGGLTFNGSSQYLNIGSSTFLGNVGAVTIGAWVKVNTYATLKALFSNYSTTDARGLIVQTSLSSNDIIVGVNDGSGPTGNTAANVYTTGTWHHWVIVFDGSQSGNAGRLKIYVDGVSLALTFSGTIPTTTGLSSAVAYIGNSPALTRFINASIDEFRISLSARSASWIATEYNNQNSPSTFYTVGSLTAVPLTVTKKIASRLFQMAQSVRKIPSRFYQITQASEKIATRVYQYRRTQRTIVSRFYQYAFFSKIAVSRFGQFSRMAQKYLSRIFQFGQSKRIAATRLFQQSTMRARIVSRYFQFASHRQSVISRVRQFDQVKRGIFSRLFSYRVSLWNFPSRFRQMARTFLIFPSRFLQFDTKIHTFASRLVFILRSSRSIVSCFKHYAKRTRSIPLRVSTYGQVAKIFVSRVSTHDRQVQIFPLRVGQRDQARSIILARIKINAKSDLPFVSRLFHFDSVKRILLLRLFSFSSQKRILPSRFFLHNSINQTIQSRLVHILIPTIHKIYFSRISHFDKNRRDVTCRLRLVEPIFVTPVIIQTMGRDGIGAARGRDGIAHIGGIA